ncbi:MAG: glutaminyl-peptide cyclotransferase [Chloroflexi bacterium]|nr:glutaminyl-peptide cyclotransferase [Chloroflexota bacterium]
MTAVARSISIALACSAAVLAAGLSASGASPSMEPSLSPSPTLASPATPSDAPVERLTWQVVSTRPHDTAAWTQGLLLDGAGDLYESTGLEGQSTIRQVDPLTGGIIRSAALPGDAYGEGLAVVDDRFLQLTWKDGLAFVWDTATLTQIGSFSYTGEGWGLCYDGARLVQSDGSSTLTFRDPATFAVLGTLPVTFQGQPVDQLNELECVDGSVWSNVWETPFIVRIDSLTGAITGALDTTGIIAAGPGVDPNYLNGIAYDAASDTFLLAGKFWPSMFEVRISGS